MNGEVYDLITYSMNILLLIICILMSFGMLLLAFRLGKTFVYMYMGTYIGFALCTLLFFVDLFGYPLAFMEVAYAVFFLTTDMFAEHYGKREAQKLVAATVVIAFVFFVISQLIIMLQPHASDMMHTHLVAMFNPMPRIVIVGLIVLLFEQLLDISIFEFIRKKTEGKRLWVRNCGSTMTTQAVDVLVFYPFAFVGVVPDLWKLMVAAYAFKVFVAMIDTPFLYLSYRVKKGS